MIRENQSSCSIFLQALGKPGKTDSGAYYWSGVSPQEVLKLINDYHFGEEVGVSRANLMTYLTNMNSVQELTSWDIVVAAGAKTDYEWAPGINARTVERKTATNRSIGVLKSDNDIKRWMKIMDRDRKDPSVGCLFLYAVDGPYAGKGSPAIYSGDDHPHIPGLLFVFPKSNRTSPATYVSQDFQ